MKRDFDSVKGGKSHPPHCRTRINYYCSDHNAGVHSRIAEFPTDFVTEAAALGGRISVIAGGFMAADYIFSNPGELHSLPMLDEQPRIKEVLEQITNAPKEKIVLLKANAPYSVLASLVEPGQFYRWLVKNPEDIHAALDRISSGLYRYIVKAFAKGVRILSLADPYASPRILGEKKYRIFAGMWLARLLKSLAEQGEGLIHLCAHSSLALEQCGLVESESVSVDEQDETCDETYIDILCRCAANGRKLPLLLGHQCIHSGQTKQMIRLFLHTAFPPLDIIGVVF